MDAFPLRSRPEYGMKHLFEEAGLKMSEKNVHGEIKAGTADEVHLVVLWNRARSREADILADIRRRMTIIGCHEITWTPERVTDNFRRFYGIKLPNCEFKVEECGSGPFLLVVVEDRSPEYGYVETSRGHERVNLNLFGLKTLYREWTGGGHKVHTSNTPQEADHDLMLLLGVTGREYLAAKDAFPAHMTRDISGSGGWKDAAELFHVLDNTVRYVVLRGIDENGSPDVDDGHGDIDLFTDAPQDLSLVLGGERHVGMFMFSGRKTGNAFRGKQVVSVGGRELLFDIWDSNLRYYDLKWSRSMLEHRTHSGGCFRLDREDAYYELLYHCLFHKEYIAADYLPSLSRHERDMGFEDLSDDEESPAYTARFDRLVDFMRTHCYSAMRPCDPTVMFNAHLLEVGDAKERLARLFGLENLKTVQMPHSAHTKLLYFKGRFKGLNVFVKCGDDPQRCRREYTLANLAWREAPSLFARPLFYRAVPGETAMCTEWVKGPSLADYLASGKSSLEVDEAAAAAVLAMAQALGRIGLVHRDLRPENLLFADDGGLRLVDFQFAVCHKSYKEDSIYRQHPELIRPLGTPEYSRFNYTWDDMYSAAKVIERLGNGPVANKAHKTALDGVGRLKVCFPRKYLRRFAFKKFLIKLIPVASLRRRVRERLRMGVL